MPFSLSGITVLTWSKNLIVYCLFIWIPMSDSMAAAIILASIERF